MKQSFKYSSDYVLCFYTSRFHVVPLLFDMLPALNEFFKPTAVEFVRLFSKPFCCNSTCAMLASEMFLESSQQP
jgi:hypothetical protein